MTLLYFVIAVLLLFFVGMPVAIAIHQAVKRGGTPTPAFTKESVLSRVAIEYKEALLSG